MASGVIKNNTVKSFSRTMTTSSAGTFTITSFPTDFHYMIGIKNNSAAGSSYVATYTYSVYGLFSLDPPHLPLANTSVTLEFWYA
jgi:hypothetical protein